MNFYSVWCNLMLMLVVGLLSMIIGGWCMSVCVMSMWCFILFDSVCMFVLVFLVRLRLVIILLI